MKMRTLLGAVVALLATCAAAAEWSEYVPVEWRVDEQETQLKTLRRLHQDYGFSRFVLIGPAPRDDFGTTETEDFAKFGDSIAWAREHLKDLDGVELGWWLAPSLRMGGGRDPHPVRNSDGTPSAAHCPLSPEFTAELKAKIAACVRHGRPRVIFIEDDFTLCCHRGETSMNGCFCELHLKAFAERVGKSHTGPEIAALYDAPTDANRSLREAFAKVCRDSLSRLAGEVRKAIDSVDPAVRTCLCQSAFCDIDGDDTEAVARAFAGRTRPMVRVCGTSYMNESVAASMPGTTAHLFWSVPHLPSDFELIHETDSYPHTRFYSSTRFLGSELSAALMAGVHGTYYYCCPYVDEPLEDDGYAAWMKVNRRRLMTVRDERAGMKTCGVRIAYSPSEVYLRRGHLSKGCFGGIPSEAEFLAKMGIPYTTEEVAESAVLFGNVAEVLSDEEIRSLLKRGVLLDGEAACILTRRGFADLIGCTAETMPDNLAYDREEIRPAAGCAAKGNRLMTSRPPAFRPKGGEPSFSGLALLKPRAGTEIWSELVDVHGKAVAPSVTYCRNAVGGRVGVMYLTPSFGYGFNGATLHFRKQELVHRLFAKLSEETLDVAAPKTPSTWTLAAKSDDELLVMVENLCGEPRDDAELVFARKWRGGRLARLDADGTWIDAGVAGERLRLGREDYEPQLPAFFKVSLKAETGFRRHASCSPTVGTTD